MGSKLVALPNSGALSQIKALTTRQKAARVRLVVFDVDGTLTDGKLYFGSQGEAMKAFSVLDGQGLALLKKAGLKLALATGRSSQIASVRAKELKIDRVLQGVKDKGQALLDLAQEFKLELHEVAMMGDDWPDLAAFSVAGFNAAPADAHVEVRRRADWVSQANGGAGAARELSDYLLKSQGIYQKLLANFVVPKGAKVQGRTTSLRTRKSGASQSKSLGVGLKSMKEQV